MNVKLGVTQWSLPGNGVFAIQTVAEAGLKGLQIELGSYERGFHMAQPRMREYYMKEAQKYNISFPSLVLNDLHYEGLINDKGSEKYNIAYESVKLGIETARAMGIKAVMIPHFLDNEIKSQQDFDRTADALKYACDLAGDDITIASEAIISAFRHVELVKKVGRKNLKIFHDSQNYKLFRNYDQLETIDGFYDYMIDQIHVKDGIGVVSSALLGKGDSNFYGTIDYLKKRNYSGWLILENYYDRQPLAKPADDYYALLAEDVRILKEAVK